RRDPLPARALELRPRPRRLQPARALGNRRRARRRAPEHRRRVLQGTRLRLAEALYGRGVVEHVLPGVVVPAWPAVEPVREPVPREDDVVPEPAVDPVAAAVSLQLVATRATREDVVAVPAVEDVLPGPA